VVAFRFFVPIVEASATARDCSAVCAIAVAPVVWRDGPLERFVHSFFSGRTNRRTVMLTTLALASGTLASTAMLAQGFPGLLTLAIIFFIIAIVAYVLGAQGVAGMSAGIGRTLLFVFLVLAVIMVIVQLAS
jgi:uncharacterized membrane protein YtjA (UPF0391 family)